MPIDLVQDVTFETDTLARFEPMLAAAVAAMEVDHLFRPTRDVKVWEYPSHSAAWLRSFLGEPPLALASWAPPDRRPAAHYLLVCRLAQRGHADLDEEPLATSDPEDLLRRALELVRAADLDAFRSATGEGPFHGCEGHVSAGYRLHGSSKTGDLRVTLCHIYYSK